MREYDFAEVLDYTKVRSTHAQRWCEAGIIETGGGGSQGKRRRFSFRNLIEVVVCNELRGLGVNEAQMRLTVKRLNAIWDQPDLELLAARADGSTRTNRDMTVLWLTIGKDGVGDRIEDVWIFPIDEAELVERLTTGTATGFDLAESGIAIPIARIIADLERETGESFAAAPRNGLATPAPLDVRQELAGLREEIDQLKKAIKAGLEAKP